MGKPKSCVSLDSGGILSPRRLFTIASVKNPLHYVLYRIRALGTICVFCGENKGCVVLGYWFLVGSGAVWISVLD